MVNMPSFTTQPSHMMADVVNGISFGSFSTDAARRICSLPAEIILDSALLEELSRAYDERIEVAKGKRGQEMNLV
jgi:hypothetical protein